MVLGSQVRGDRSSAAIPDVEVRPEIEFRQEPETDNPAEIEVFVFTICEGNLGATRPITAEKPSETVSKYVSGDKPKIAITFPSSVNKPKPTFHTTPSPNPHFQI